MNKIAVLLVGFACVVLVNCRHYEDRNSPEKVEDEEFEAKRYRDRGVEQRHRRRRWQAAYGYDYQPHSSYYSDRRNSYERNDEAIQQIFRILDDLADYIKRNQQQPPPPPPPQPIYIPYPVPYLVPQYIICKPTNGTNQPSVGPRIKGMEDVNQNWGFVMNDNIDYEDDGTDGARPISFDPIKPKNILMRPLPKVEHGSIQAETTTRKSRVPVPAAPAVQAPPAGPSSVQPGPCNAAILSCCGNANQSKRRECFISVGCEATFTNDGCSQESITRALDSFKLAYSPVN